MLVRIFLAGESKVDGKREEAGERGGKQEGGKREERGKKSVGGREMRGKEGRERMLACFSVLVAHPVHEMVVSFVIGFIRYFSGPTSLLSCDARQHARPARWKVNSRA